ASISSILPRFVPTERKIELIDALSDTGVAKIEVTSFVSPKAVPNLRDAEEVMAGIRRNPAVRYVALIANVRGAERAIAARVDEVVLVVSVSETHNRANVRRSTAASFEGFREIMRELKGTDIAVTGALSTSFGCPFAPGATGNICTEDLVHMLEAMGYGTGVDLDKLLAASRRLGEIVAHDLPGQVVKAGKTGDLHPAPVGLVQKLS